MRDDEGRESARYVSRRKTAPEGPKLNEKMFRS